MREKLASRLGFIFLSAGCAIGLGNVWRFPYIAGQNGGGWFVALYLVALALIGLPILLMEFAAGRAAQRSIARLHATLTPEKKAWRLHGVAGFLGNVLLMMFYTTVTGGALVFLALPCLLGFSVWGAFQPFGAGSCVLDLEDFLVSNLILPLGGLAFALYCCHRFGWGWRNFLAEANTGHGPRVPSALRVSCAYVLPVLVAGIFVLGLVDKFAPRG